MLYFASTKFCPKGEGNLGSGAGSPWTAAFTGRENQQKGERPLRFLNKPAGRPRLLVGPAEFDVIAAGVEPVASRGGRGKHLQRHGALHFRVVLRGGLQEVIRAEVHHHKFSAVEETEAVGAGLQGLTGDFESNLVEQIGLVFLPDSRGVSGAVNYSRENIEIISEVNATAVAELDRRTLAAKKNAFREYFWRNVGGLEDNLLACGGRVLGSYGMQILKRQAQKHERQKNEKPLESDHGNSFEDAGIVHHLVSFRKKETRAIGAAPVPL